jgi:hypothetical protein
MSQTVATKCKRSRQFPMARGYSVRHTCDMEDIKKLIAQEVRRQRFDEHMVEHNKKVTVTRARLTWGSVGMPPVPRLVQGTDAKTSQIAEPQVEAPPSSTPAPPLRVPMRPGPKPGKAADAQQAAWNFAESILLDPDRRPARGYGRLIKLVALIKPQMEKARYEHRADTIRKQIGPSLRAWESKNSL